MHSRYLACTPMIITFATYHRSSILRPRKYHIDLKAIEQTYWKLQKRLHPDLFGSKSQVSHTISA